jgi:hypothetical protein
VGARIADAHNIPRVHSDKVAAVDVIAAVVKVSPFVLLNADVCTVELLPKTIAVPLLVIAMRHSLFYYIYEVYLHAI